MGGLSSGMAQIFPRKPPKYPQDTTPRTAINSRNAAARYCERSQKASNRDGVWQGESLGPWAMDLGMGVSCRLEFFQNGAGGECRGVTVFAQVREEDMAQIGAGDFGNEAGCGLVGEVAVPGENALLHRPRTVLIVLKEGLVMIRFDEDGIDAASGVHDLTRRVAEIRENGEG